MCRVAIIGGGPNGVIAANEVLRQLPDAEVLLFGRGRWGHGLVYGEAELASSRQSFITSEMSVDPHDKQALESWISQNRERLKGEYPDRDLNRDSYPPRRIIGRYFEDQIDVAIKRGGNRLQLHEDPVQAITGSPGSYRCVCESGSAYRCDAAFLCLGNFPSVWGEQLRGHPNYQHEIWGRDFFAEIDTQERVLIAGAGLSSIDVLWGLNGRGHRGSVTFASRHGYLPTVQAPHIDAHLSADSLELIAQGLSLEQYRVLGERECRRFGGRQMWDGLRPGRLEISDLETPAQATARLLADHMPLIWGGFSLEEKRVFDRQCNAVWNSLQLPMARHSAEMLFDEMSCGRLGVGILDFIEPSGYPLEAWEDPGAVSIPLFRATVDGQEQPYDRVINATGRNLNVKRIDDQLVSQLLRDKLLSSHPAGGFDVDSESSAGRGQGAGLYVLGPLSRGVRFYTYVLSQNADQAVAAVDHLRSRCS